MQIRRTAAALTSAAALSITGTAMATPAQAAPVFTGGLVNVTVFDVVDAENVLNDNLSDNNVNVVVAAQIIATVCADVDAAVGVIARQIVRSGGFACEVTGPTGDVIRTLTVTQR